MKKYLVLYFSSFEAKKRVEGMSKEKKEEGMKAWFSWKDRLGDRLVDFGVPFTQGIKLDCHQHTTDSNTLVSYSFIHAENMEEAKQMVTNHPHFSYGNDMTIEVHECMEVNW